MEIIEESGIIGIMLITGFTQAQFDEALKVLKNNTIAGAESRIIEEPTHIELVDGYWDIDDRGYSIPCFWYNKKELDKRGIKYGSN